MNTGSLKRKKTNYWMIPVHILFVIITLAYVLPLLMVVSISLSSEQSVTQSITGQGGYSLLPVDFTWEAYKLCFRNPDTIIQGYKVTIFTSVVGTAMRIMLEGMTGFALARNNFAFKKQITWYLFITTLFGGGMIPTYIIYTQTYHLGNTIWIYLLPGLSGVGNIWMMRAFIKGLGVELYESAWLDGANEFTIFLKIAAPLAKPMLAACAFNCLVGKWNDWGTSLVYIRDPNLFTLQYLLQRMLNEVEFIKSIASQDILGINAADFVAPAETMRYAMLVIAAGPMLFIFPFFQKYFAKGLTIGAVKG